MPVDPYRIIYPPTVDFEEAGTEGRHTTEYPVHSSMLDPPPAPLSRAISDLSSQFGYPTMESDSYYESNSNRDRPQVTRSAQPEENTNRGTGTSKPVAYTARLVDVTASAIAVMLDELARNADVKNDGSADGDGATDREPENNSLKGLSSLSVSVSR